MDKVAIVTLVGYFNFGNRLQNYALTKVLEKMGYDTYSVRNWNLKKIIKENIKLRLFFIKKYKRLRPFYKFTKENIKEISLSDIKRKKIKKIIVGSDQVWNPKYYEEDHNFLYNPLKDETVISYAASIGTSEINEKYHKTYKKILIKYDKISVRERTAELELKKITGRDDIVTLVDPTMLLSKEEWQNIERKPSKYIEGKRYILNYFLGDVSEEEKKAINEFAINNDCTIINILDKKDSFNNCGPKEFIYLINHSYLICTDSFHSCVFSFIFNKPFIVFKRKGCSNEMYSRIENLIKTFDLKDREFSGSITKSLIEHNYSNGYKKLEEEKKKGIDFLLQ